MTDMDAKLAGELALKYMPLMVNITKYRMRERWSMDDVHDVFIDVFSALLSYDGVGISTVVSTVANQSLTRKWQGAKRHKRRVNTESEPMGEKDAFIVDKTINITEREHNQIRVLVALKVIDDDLRDTVLDYFFHGMSGPEIALKEGVSRQAINMRIKKAINQMKDIMRYLP